MSQEDYSRRDFIVKTAVAGAAFGLAGCSGSSDEGGSSGDQESGWETAVMATAATDTEAPEEPDRDERFEEQYEESLYKGEYIEVVSAEISGSNMNVWYEGDIRNVSDKELRNIDLEFEYYNEDGEVIADDYYDSNAHFSPGEETFFNSEVSTYQMEDTEHEIYDIVDAELTNVIGA